MEPAVGLKFDSSSALHGSRLCHAIRYETRGRGVLASLLQCTHRPKATHWPFIANNRYIKGVSLYITLRGR